MSCGGTTGARQRRLDAMTTGGQIEWFSDWQACIGMDEIFAVMKAKSATSEYFEGQLVIQTANVRPSQPNAPIAKGTVQTPTSGSFEYPVSLNIANDTSGAAFIRFGVLYSYADGQAPASADVELEVAWVQFGQMLASATHQLSTTTTEDQVIAISDMMPGILVHKVKGVVICRSLTGYFRWRLAYRTAATSKEDPGAWNLVTDTNAPYAAGEFNTGDLSVSVGTNMWVQLGLLYDLPGGCRTGHHHRLGRGQAVLSDAPATHAPGTRHPRVGARDGHAHGHEPAAPRGAETPPCQRGGSARDARESPARDRRRCGRASMVRTGGPVRRQGR